MRVAGFDAVVELLAQPRRELGDEILDLVLAAPGRARLDDVAELLEHRQVDPHRLVDAGPLHLHHDVRPVGQLRPVHLADRRRRDRLPVEAAEHVAHRDVELLLEHLGDAVTRRRPHVVLQQAELGGRLRRDQVGAGAEHLAELHEHPAALLEREAQAPHRRARRRGVDVVLATESERRAEAVAHRDAGDLGVPLHPPPAPAQRAHRMRHRLQTGLRPHDDPGPGEELEPHRGRHGAEQREEEEVAGEAFGRGMGVGRDPERHHHARRPSRSCRTMSVAANERRTPSTRPMSAPASSANANAGTSSHRSSPRRSNTEVGEGRGHRRPEGASGRSELHHRELAVGVLRAQHLLVELADARLGHLGDERPPLGELPLRHVRRRGTRAARSASRRHPSRSTTHASGRSSQRASGTAITAASTTSGCAMRWPSSSTDEIHSPPDLMTSFARSVIWT